MSFTDEQVKRPNKVLLKGLAIAAIVVVAFVAWANWWRVSFRSSRVIGLTETQLVDRFGAPNLDTRSTHARIYGQGYIAEDGTIDGETFTDQELAEIRGSIDPDDNFELIWYTGIGTTHAKVRLIDGEAASVSHGTHR